MATLGATLAAPESGWKRVDNTDPAMRYMVSWSPSTDGSAFMGTLNLTSTFGSFFGFNFTGTGVRLIGLRSTSGNSIIDVYLDGAKVDTVTQYKATTVYKSLDFDKSGLEDKEHYIYFIHNNPAGGQFYVDSVDIMSTGTVKTYNPWVDPAKTKTSVATTKVGDRVVCKYTATTQNVVGTFSQLGTATMGEISGVPGSTSDGTFYFVHVGYDWKGRKKFMADRILQNYISWATLNTKGFCSHTGISTAIDGNAKAFVLRLPGSANSLYRAPSDYTGEHDVYDEWDAIMAQPGMMDPFLWNQHTTWSWTMSFSSYSVRTARGNLSYGTILSEGDPTPDLVNAAQGFRPILIVDPSTITVDLVTPTHIYADQHGGTVLRATPMDITGVVGNYKVTVNSVDVSPMGPDTERVLPMSIFNVGANNVALTAEDGAYNAFTVFREAPFRTLVERTFLPYDGGYDLQNAKLDKAMKAVDTARVGILKTTAATNVMLTGYSGITNVKVNGTGKMAVSFNGGLTWQAYSCGIDEFVSSYLNFNSGLTDATGKTWTSVNGPTIQPGGKFGTSALYLNGTQYLSTAPSEDLNCYGLDFTIDFNFKLDAVNTTQALISQCNTVSSGYGPVLLQAYWDGTSCKLRLLTSQTGSSWDSTGNVGTTNLAALDWYHVAIVRNGNAINVYLNGALEISIPYTVSFSPSTSNFIIGAQYGSGSYGAYLKGFIDEFRFSKGIARWDAPFTQPGTSYLTGYWGPVMESDIMTTGMSSVVCNMITSADWKTVFQKTNLDFMFGVTGNQAMASLSVTLPNNQPPKASNLKLTPGVVHSGLAYFEADIIDEEEQECWYRVLIDNTPTMDWKKFNRLVHVNHPIQINNVALGLHSVTLECKDVLDAHSSYSINFTRVNSDPFCTVAWDSKHISATLGDSDNDYIQYRLIINGTTKIDWTDWLPAGYNMTYRFRRRELAIGQLNQVRLEYRDTLGGKGSWTQNIVGTYNNIMFLDTFGAYYSDDTGITIQILDLGTLIAGSDLGPVEIRIKNETGWPVKNIQVWATNPYLPEVLVEFSHTLSPFNPVDPWLVTATLADGDQIPLFVKLTSVDTAYRGGDFKLNVKADLVLDSAFVNPNPIV